MTAIVDAAIGSIPVIGDAYGVFQTLGGRGTQAINAIKAGDARGTLGALAAGGVEMAGEAFIPDNPAVGAVHAATGMRPETFVGDFVHDKIVNSGGHLHKEGEKGQGKPIKLTEKQQAALKKISEECAKAMQEGKDLPKEMQEAMKAVDKASKGLDKEQKDRIKGQVVNVAESQAKSELMDEAMQDGEISEKEAAEMAAFEEEIRKMKEELGIEMSEEKDKGLKNQSAAIAKQAQKTMSLN